MKITSSFLLLIVFSIPLFAVGENEEAFLVIAQRVDHLDKLAREPMIVQHPDGSLFVTGYSHGDSVPNIWKSKDSGATWDRINVGTQADGAVCNSDIDLAVARDGTLYAACMTFAQSQTEPLVWEGKNIAAGVSKDAGVTWTWTSLAQDRFDDRPWVEVSGDGVAHVIWNDLNGVHYAISKDGGHTWTQLGRILLQGGSSHLAAGPEHQVAVRITPLSASGNLFNPGIDLIAISLDGVENWRAVTAPGERQWSLASNAKLQRWVEPVAWDANGALYSLWTDVKGVWLARTEDQGDTWKTWMVKESKPDQVFYFPYLIARGNGELAASWFSNEGKETREMKAYVVLINISGSDAPLRVVESPPIVPDSWIPNDDPKTPQAPDTAGEYLAVTFLNKGGLAAVSAVQNIREHRTGFTFWKLVSP